MVVSTEERHRSAAELVNRGRVAEAIRLLERALADAEDANVRARLAGTLAYALAKTGELERSEELITQALGVAGVDAHTRAVLSGQLGALAQQAGRLDDAQRWLSRGIESLHEDAPARANLHITRGLLGIERRDLRTARDDTLAAIAVYEREGMDEAAAQARHNLGYIALLEGDLVAALAAMGEARSVLAGLSPASAAIGDVDRAEVLRDAGLTGEAERILASSAVVFGRQRLPQARAEAEVALAAAQLTHDPAAAA
ncbi:MAG: hypothetical protein QM602_10550, partial [Microbacterium sp.]